MCRRNQLIGFAQFSQQSRHINLLWWFGGQILMFALLAICIVIAPGFSGEYQAGTDAVILSAKYGKTRLVTAKIAASFLFGTTGVYNLLLFLLPYRSTMPEFGKFISYQFGGMVLDVLTVRAVLYVILTVIMLPLARLGFKKHQVA